jgi:hypothetical protein
LFVLKEFWECGHDLFKSTPEIFPAGFVAGDAFSPSTIEPREPFYSSPSSPRPTDLKALTSLTPLQGHTSAIHASSFFHLFDENQQLTLAKQLATLLSPQPGSMLFGIHGGQPVKGLRAASSGRSMFCHSPESWIELWDGVVFKRGSVKVEASIEERRFPTVGPSDDAVRFVSALVWCVTRV